MMIHVPIDEVVELLRPFAENEGSEAGEYWTILCELSRRKYCMSDEFWAAFEKEVRMCSCS